MIRKLLVKDELRRLGSQSGASEVKQHKWFSPISWGLLRNSTPPVSFRVSNLPIPRDDLLTFISRLLVLHFRAHQIVPAFSNGLDAINFRTVRESRSLNLDGQGSGTPKTAEIRATAGKKGVGDEEGDAVVANPFSGFSSVTLHHDDE